MNFLDYGLIALICIVWTAAIAAIVARMAWDKGEAHGTDMERQRNIPLILAAKLQGARQARLELGHGVVKNGCSMPTEWTSELVDAPADVMQPIKPETTGDWNIDPLTLSAKLPDEHDIASAILAARSQGDWTIDPVTLSSQPERP